MKMTSEQILDLTKDLVTATMEIIELEQKINLANAGRLTGIINEATGDLRSTFSEADACFEDPQTPAEELRDKYQEIRRRSIASLQFDDIATQVLGQYQQRGESMLSSLYRLYELLQTLENEDPYIDLVRLKKQLGREVSRHKHTTDSFNSVKQDNLNSGTIELF